MTIRCTSVRRPPAPRKTFDRQVGLVIPAFNEARHLPELLARCRDVAPAVIVVVDDASSDDTPQVLGAIAARAPGVPLRVLRNRRNLGKQGAVRRGLRALRTWKLDAVALLDGDGQHDPAELPALAALLDEHDVVLGARSHAEMPAERRASNWAVNFGFRSIAGVDFVDVQSGLRLFRKPLADALGARLPITGDYGVEYESLVVLARRAAERGESLHLAAAPIACRYGAAKSGIRPRHMMRLAQETVRQAVRLRVTAATEPSETRPPAPRALTVELHDVTPAHETEVRAMHEVLADLGIDRVTLLVVPAFRDEAGGSWDLRDHPSFAEWLRRRQGEGSDIVQHGLTHRAVEAPPGLQGRLVHEWFARGCEEFAWLSHDEARERLRAGRWILDACGLRADGFVAPAWLQSDGTRLALDELCFRWTASFGHVRPLFGDRTPVPSPALTFAAPNPLADYGKRLMMRGTEALALPAPLLRVALHPEDLHGARPFDHVRSRLRLLLRYRRPVTYATWLVERSGREAA
jgi:predicted deacetylase